jgi:chromosomal replication initiation ATPase DnaA
MSRPAIPVPWAVERAALVCVHLGVSLQQFSGCSRHPKVVEAREFVTYILREFPGPRGEVLSFPEIAASMGRPNHSTSITAYRRVTGDENRERWANEVAAKIGIGRPTAKER